MSGFLPWAGSHPSSGEGLGRHRAETAGRSRTQRNAPLTVFSLVSGAFRLEWQVRDSNPRRLSRLIYSQIPLAAWVTCRGSGRCPAEH